MEDFQKKVKKYHKKWLIRLITKGGQKAGSAYVKKPSLKRSKSSPPGFQGLEENHNKDTITLYRGMNQEELDRFKKDGKIHQSPYNKGNAASTNKETAEHYAKEWDDGNGAYVIKFTAPENVVRQDDLHKEDYRFLESFTPIKHKIYSVSRDEQLNEIIVKRGDKFCLVSKHKSEAGKRKNLGCYSSREGAEKREKQVQYFKHIKEEVLKEISGLLKEQYDKEEPTIFCDMDGVLVDFEHGAVKLVNEFMTKQGKPQISQSDLDNKEIRQIMFRLIYKNPGAFFGSLPPLSDGVESLWPWISGCGLNVALLTAGIKGSREAPTSEQGKNEWANRELNPKPQKLILKEAKLKHEYAVTNGIQNILIDDKAATIESWNAAGGIGILHEPGNSRKTIIRLKALGI